MHYWTNQRTSKELKVCKEWKSSIWILQEIMDLVIMIDVGITMKELEELKLGPLLII